MWLIGNDLFVLNILIDFILVHDMPLCLDLAIRSGLAPCPIDAVFGLCEVTLLVIVGNAEAMRLAKHHCNVLIHFIIPQDSLPKRQSINYLPSPS